MPSPAWFTSSASTGASARTAGRKAGWCMGLQLSGRGGRLPRTLAQAEPGSKPSIPPRQQPPRDHLRLDLGGALEDVEDARVAEHAGDLLLLGVPVADVQHPKSSGRGKSLGERVDLGGLRRIQNKIKTH